VPAAVGLAGFGPAVFFPLSAGLVAATVGSALCFRDWREFGATAWRSPPRRS
jgi:hypothetical protein